MSGPRRSTGAIPKSSLIPPHPRQAILQKIINSKANPEYKTRRLWYELNLPECTKDIFNGKRLSMDESEVRHTRCMQPERKRTRRSRNTKYRSYLQMRQDRENFRKKLIELIARKDHEADETNQFPNAEEKEIMRYYYYIKHGIDTIHVSPLSTKVLARIKGMIPQSMLRFDMEMTDNLTQIKSDYIFAMKKAVIDFVLSNSLQCEQKENDLKDTQERIEAKATFNRWRYRYDENRLKIKKTLFSIHRCVAHILALWTTKFKGLAFIDIDDLSSHFEAFDLFAFTNQCSSQIEKTKLLLKENWYGEIHSILLRGHKRNILPDVRKPKLLSRFYNCVAALMTQQLEDVCIRSLTLFADFMCDYGKSNPGIKLAIQLEDQDTLVFNPSFSKIKEEIMRIIDNIILAIQQLPRVETKLYTDLKISKQIYLKPAIPESIIFAAKRKISDLLEDQRIGPELRLQDFDQFMSLMNGIDADTIGRFIESEPPFESYCNKLIYYRQLEDRIAKEIWGVIRRGLYEFHREGLITNLEKLARFMQQELLTTMVGNQQTKISKLGKEYETIAKKALTIPENTAELMSLKAFVAQTEDRTAPEMEQRLKIQLWGFSKNCLCLLSF